METTRSAMTIQINGPFVALVSRGRRLLDSAIDPLRNSVSTARPGRRGCLGASPTA